MFTKPLYFGNFSNCLWWWLQILSENVTANVTLVKQCLEMKYFFPWILLKTIIHLLSTKSSLLQYKDQNKTQFGSKEITRQQIFKGVSVLGDSDVLIGSNAIIFFFHLSSLIAHMRDDEWPLSSRLVNAVKETFGQGNTQFLHMRVKVRPRHRIPTPVFLRHCVT